MILKKERKKELKKEIKIDRQNENIIHSCTCKLKFNAIEIIMFLLFEDFIFHSPDSQKSENYKLTGNTEGILIPDLFIYEWMNIVQSLYGALFEKHLNTGPIFEKHSLYSPFYECYSDKYPNTGPNFGFPFHTKIGLSKVRYSHVSGISLYIFVIQHFFITKQTREKYK